jgi:hypothetical protein
MVEKPGVEAVVRDIKLRARRGYSGEEKLRIVQEEYLAQSGNMAASPRTAARNCR